MSDIEQVLERVECPRIERPGWDEATRPGATAEDAWNFAAQTMTDAEALAAAYRDLEARLEGCDKALGDWSLHYERQKARADEAARVIRRLVRWYETHQDQPEAFDAARAFLAKEAQR